MTLTQYSKIGPIREKFEKFFLHPYHRTRGAAVRYGRRWQDRLRRPRRKQTTVHMRRGGGEVRTSGGAGSKYVLNIVKNATFKHLLLLQTADGTPPRTPINNLKILFLFGFHIFLIYLRHT